MRIWKRRHMTQHVPYLKVERKSSAFKARAGGGDCSKVIEEKSSGECGQIPSEEAEL